MPSVEELAYALWEARGHRDGDDWADWFAAERELPGATQNARIVSNPMGKSITMFMWGYQGHFRINLEIRAKALLQEIAPTLEPEVVLVGVRVPENMAGLPVCVEPEDGEWDTAPFAECGQRAAEIYETHDDHNVMYGDEARTRDQPENIRKSSVRRAVKEVFDLFDRANGTTTFCSWPERVGGYHVVCALQLSKAQLDEYPVIDKPITHGQFSFSGGFVTLVIRKLLDEARKALWGPDPGRFHDVLDVDGEALFRAAGDELCSALTLATGDITFQGIFENLNKISALLYEGTEGIGRLVFATPDHSGVRMQISFTRPVRLEESRWARKILEMARGDLCGVCTGRDGVRGLGELTNAEAEGLFAVDFLGHFRWQLRHGGKVLLESAFGAPRLPRALIKEATYKSTFRRLFTRVDAQAEERTWQIVDASTRQRHGTTIVISEDAQKEAKRLGSQSTPITPVVLSADLVERVSGIDGAILIDKAGKCWALGVILDGEATERGNPARGARFNSAIRYLDSKADIPTLVLVISEDESVDMIPTLRPQIARSVLERWMRRLRNSTFDNFHKVRNWLWKNRFYLDAEQCRVVNEEIARIEGTPRDPRLAYVPTGTFEPHPDMDESYYLPEERSSLPE